MKKIIIFLMIIIMMLLTVGCTSKKEIEKLAIIVSFGVDRTSDGKYMVSTQILKGQKSSSGGMGGGKNEKQPTDVMSLISTGDTVPDALEHLSTKLGKKIILSHVKFIVIGEDTAKSGVGDLVNFVAREHELRPNIIFLIAKGKASEILKTITPEATVPTNTIVAILNLQSEYGYTPVVTSLDFSTALASKTASPLAGVIALHQDEQAGTLFKLLGTAVFNKDKLIGYMDEQETRGMQWITGKVTTGNIVIPSPDTGNITLDIIQADSTIRPIIINNKPIIQITITEKGNIREMSGKLNIMKSPDIITALEEIQNEAIKREIEKALYAAQQTFKADIFDFGGTIHRDYPADWKNFQGNWREMFPDLTVEITVNSSIPRIGTISKPLY